MSASRTGALAGIIVGLVIVLAGFWQAVLVLALGLVGFIIGRIVEGQLDVRDIFGTGQRRDHQ